VWHVRIHSFPRQTVSSAEAVQSVSVSWLEWSLSPILAFVMALGTALHLLKSRRPQARHAGLTHVYG
jgi:hypothetical protein